MPTLNIEALRLVTNVNAFYSKINSLYSLTLAFFKWFPTIPFVIKAMPFDTDGYVSLLKLV